MTNINVYKSDNSIRSKQAINPEFLFPKAPLSLLIGVLLLFHMLFFSKSVLAQSPNLEVVAGPGPQITELRVGDKVPAGFWSHKHLFVSQGDTLRRDFTEHKGKMLVLGFWATWCSACLKNQPEIESYVQSHSKDLAVIRVNPNRSKDNLKTIEKALNGQVGKFSGIGFKDMFSVIEDGYLQQLFPNRGFPYYVWINKYGVVQLITYRNLLDQKFDKPYID